MLNNTHEGLINYAHTESKKIALIYSPIELHEYLVEVILKDSVKFIKKNNEIVQFHSIADALSQAQKYGAEEFFLCVDNTYDECGSTASAEKYDYIPISPK
ncbi:MULTISPECIES: DUF6482 family protein [Legionella]|uniref:Uncharacterized protein n=1 Tax=Legionella donaldsonii TaxID=45060 RepID=A0A378J1I4_9GAMM|nr:DUF6482 family protein [Legionella donaldsonii]STX41465.1 Uncharacterised protein [Legionella donaldsonii]